MCSSSSIVCELWRSFGYTNASPKCQFFKYLIWNVRICQGKGVHLREVEVIIKRNGNFSWHLRLGKSPLWQFGEIWLELQALVAPRIFFFCNLFLGSEYFAQRFNRPLDKNGRDISETLKKLPYLTGLLKLSKLPTFSKRCPQCLTSLLLKTRCYMLCQK